MTKNMESPRDRLDKARREEIIRAGWEGDTALRNDLGGFEQATWEIGACARDPNRIHAYAGLKQNGVRDQSTWQPDIDFYRAKWSATTTLVYTNWRGSTEPRTITPTGKMVWVEKDENKWHPDPQWLIEAHDEKSGEIRLFALSGFSGKP